MEHEREKENIFYLNQFNNLSNLRASYYFRDIVTTGYAALTRGQEVTVMPGTSSRFVDLWRVNGASTSESAIAVDIRSGTGSGIMDTILIPATSVLGNMWHVYDIPLPASEQNVPWTARVQGSDISDSPVTITMVGIKISKRSF